MAWLINAAQLDKFRKSQKSLVILDASWHAPTTQRNAKQEFAEKHIIGAQFLDIDLFNDTNGAHPKMLLRDAALLSERLGHLGLRNDFKIIFYDNSQLHTACRALWMFKMMGHNPQQLYIFDGNLDTWEKSGGKVESGEVTISPKSYTVNWQARYLRTLAEMKDNLLNPKEQVVDMRHAVRYAGGPEDRSGLRPGHIPGSYSFPYSSFFDANGQWRSPDKIRACLNGIGLDLHSPIITTCGSGTTAAIMNFALDILNLEQNAMYNGSWTEWGSEKCFAEEQSLDERPVATCTDN